MSFTANSISNIRPTAMPHPLPAGAPQAHAESVSDFVDRRESGVDGGPAERRQFGSSHSDLSPDAFELATAIDRYKVERRRRYITCEEMLAVVRQLGYHRDE